MASGGKDYWFTAYTFKSVASATLLTWFKSVKEIVIGGETEEVCTYTVPVGKILHVCGCCLSCEAPGIMDVEIYFGADNAINIFFDGEFNLNFGGGNDFEVVAGDSCYFEIKNNEAPQYIFRATFYGFLETL